MIRDEPRPVRRLPRVGSRFAPVYDWQQAAAWYADGMTGAEIRRRLGCSLTQFYRWRRDSGLPLRRPAQSAAHRAWMLDFHRRAA